VDPAQRRNTQDNDRTNKGKYRLCSSCHTFELLPDVIPKDILDEHRDDDDACDNFPNTRCNGSKLR